MNQSQLSKEEKLSTIIELCNDIEIDGETIYGIAADWGVRLGSVNVAGQTRYNRIELVRKNMVVEYLNKPKA